MSSNKKRYASRWHLDYTYIKIKGEWKYLYRAIDEQGNTIDFYLFHRRNAKAAKRFLKKLVKSNATYDISIINTDKNQAYCQAIKELKQEGNLDSHVSHLQIKYCNNRLEAYHGKLKRLINPVRGFQSMKTAYATIKGFEMMRMFKMDSSISGCMAILLRSHLLMNNLESTDEIYPENGFL